MNNKKIDLLGWGDPFLDLVVDIDRLPESNTNCPMHERCFQGGGNVATALVAAARLGMKTSLIGSVGDDLFGKLSLADLEYNKVDTSRMVVHKDKKAISAFAFRSVRFTARSLLSVTEILRIWTGGLRMRNT